MVGVLVAQQRRAERIGRIAVGVIPSFGIYLQDPANVIRDMHRLAFQIWWIRALALAVTFHRPQVNALDALPSLTLDNLAHTLSGSIVHVIDGPAPAQIYLAQLVEKVPDQACQVGHSGHIAINIIAIAGRVRSPIWIAGIAAAAQLVCEVARIILVGIVKVLRPVAIIVAGCVLELA